ncbi:hypothetical protein chiPu_0025976 [Chiloscyllium punctatum]|uniref:Uncharacterized protein n=1 Tax=Chiloscyllium punctatum TaxID=137246 RepID=A0A401TGS2_CHIPU|nr:hypothetical protein [Chiloscyllium punctatum]
MGHWGTSGLLQHPAFSDASGKIRLSRKDFYPLRGWQWDGKWTIDPERCLLFDADAGHNEFTDEVYENETHLAGGEWSPALEQWTDKVGVSLLLRNLTEMYAGVKHGTGKHLVVDS